MGQTRKPNKPLLNKIKERYHSEDLGIDGMIISKWMLNTVRIWIGFIRLKTSSSGDLL
jgi:hypothetical protein